MSDVDYLDCNIGRTEPSQPQYAEFDLVQVRSHGKPVAKVCKSALAKAHVRAHTKITQQPDLMSAHPFSSRRSKMFSEVCLLQRDNNHSTIWACWTIASGTASARVPPPYAPVLVVAHDPDKIRVAVVALPFFFFGALPHTHFSCFVSSLVNSCAQAQTCCLFTLPLKGLIMTP